MSIKIVGIKTHNLSVLSDTEQSKAKAIYKALAEDTFYPLYAGYTMVGEYLLDTIDIIDMYNEDKDITKINICAIVGANGSGKSSFIEMIMRIVNNFACHCIGEYKANNAAEHLTYVDDVYATLVFVKDNNPFTLIVKGRNVHLYKRDEVLSDFIFTDSTTPIPTNEDYLKRNKILKSLFYTIVNNFALYSYNTNDFEDEYCPTERIDTINTALPTKLEFSTHISNYLEEETEPQKKALTEIAHTLDAKKMTTLTQEINNPIKLYGEEGTVMIRELNDDSTVEGDDAERCWIQGIFHKNDGYTVPIVITPFRDRGIIDVSQENYFAIQRFLFLLLYKNTEGNFPFRKIDNNLYAEKIVMSLHADDNANLAKVMRRFDLDSRRIKHYIEINNQIFNCWIETLGICGEISSIESKPWYCAIKNYITCKTVKISYNYSSYNPFMDRLKSALNQDVDIDMLDVKSHIEQIIQNPSHITQKLRQALAFLKFGHIEYGKQVDNSYSLDNLFGIIERNVVSAGEKLFCGYDYCITKWDLLPPPVFKIDFLLSNQNSTPNIKFKTLSSGQKQLIYFKSSVLYHLINLNSAFSDTKTNRPQYKDICMIFEEVELYFHPELQRKLIKELIDSIRLVNIDNITGIQMIFITHSPFILSDIPKSCCLFLENDGKPTSRQNMQTFSANLFDILNSSFFLDDGIIGEFASSKIKSILCNKYYCEKDIKIANEICDEAIRRFVLSELNTKNTDSGNLMHEIEQLKDENIRLRRELERGRMGYIKLD